jgi:DNA replication initiation complex subunit (GINS family)
MRELSAPQLTTIEEPDNFYQSIKAFMDEKIDKGDNSLTTTKLMNQLNQFIDSRMNKILMTCFRHYNSEKILEEQKALMTPQELEMAGAVINSIRNFREFIYH